MERIGEDQLVKRLVGSDVRGVRLRGRSQTEWMDGVKRAMNERGTYMEQGRIIMHDRSEYRAVVHD